MLDEMRRARGSGVAEIRLVLLSGVEDWKPGGAGVLQDVGDFRDDRPDGRDVDAGTLEHPAVGTEVVLHVDDDQHGAIEVDVDRRGPGR